MIVFLSYAVYTSFSTINYCVFSGVKNTKCVPQHNAPRDDMLRHAYCIFHARKYTIVEKLVYTAYDKKILPDFLTYNVNCIISFTVCIKK